MFKVNEYFDGKVKSLAFQTTDGPATIGVMAPGEYEFGTSTVEIMSVVSGALTVKLPGSDDWNDYKAGDELHGRGREEVPAEGRGRRGLSLPLPLRSGPAQPPE